MYKKNVLGRKQEKKKPTGTHTHTTNSQDNPNIYTIENKDGEPHIKMCFGEMSSGIGGEKFEELLSSIYMWKLISWQKYFPKKNVVEKTCFCFMYMANQSKSTERKHENQKTTFQCTFHLIFFVARRNVELGGNAYILGHIPLWIRFEKI